MARVRSGLKVALRPPVKSCTLDHGHSSATFGQANPHRAEVNIPRFFV